MRMQIPKAGAGSYIHERTILKVKNRAENANSSLRKGVGISCFMPSTRGPKNVIFRSSNETLVMRAENAIFQDWA